MLRERNDILIIGAGAAGLAAACELCNAGMNVTILEARNRLGGRIYTLEDPVLPVPMELGAEFIHGNLPVTLNLLKKYKIDYQKVKGEIWQSKNGELKKSEELVDDASLLDTHLKNITRDISVEAFLRTYFEGQQHSALKNSVRKFIESYDAADPNRASIFAFRKEWEQSEQWKQYRINSGYMSLINALAADCSNKGCSINLLASVNEISWDKSGVEISCSSGKVYAANSALITVPLGVLRAEANSKAFISFRPELPDKIAAARALGYGGAIKIILHFNEAFWKNKSIQKNARKNLENLGFLFSYESIPTWWTQAPEPVASLTGWIAGPAAEQLKLADQNKILYEALQSLASIFHEEISELRDKLTVWKVINWVAEPYSLGAYTYATVNAKSHIETLRKPVEHVLYFAGEAIHHDSDIGTVEAALSSGILIARKILATKTFPASADS